MRSQVEHSKVRSSKPRFPGEIRVNPNLCLQVGHIGRTLFEAISLTVPHDHEVSDSCDALSTSNRSWRMAMAETRGINPPTMQAAVFIATAISTAAHG